ncbi:hypothetical protein [Polyangium aurulentum]|uniref:hypothetical protein n=1 Tax=Polyangium aurulentum TaxID=2567896 RepID=UPI0010AE3814|nr:hypothetical protein [Polyangium aurulentum]UQA58237.1 hypothetical protein E8A73_044480 [Polyangium aurulentum]
MGSAEREPVDAPPVHLIKVELTGLDASNQPTTLTLTPSEPLLSESTPALSTTSLRLTFDRFLLPASAVRQAICLQASADPVATLNDCTQGVFLEPSYDPVRRQVTYRVPAGEALVADARYWLTVLSSPDPSGFGVRAFDGAPLEKTLVLQFSTAAMDPAGMGPVDPPLDDVGKRAASEELFCAASACVAACGDDMTCASKCPVAQSLTLSCGGCHGPIELGIPAMGLDMSTPERLAWMNGQVAHQTMTGEHADEPDQQPRRFGRAMPLVDPGNPGNSYALYKMLVGPIYRATPLAQGMQQGEMDRLRGSVVVGLPMPPSDVYAVPAQGIEAISAWIMTGAETPACP